MTTKTAYNDPALPLATYVLLLSCVVTLARKGLLSNQDVKEMLEQALLNLETVQADMDPAGQETIVRARALLDHGRDLVALRFRPPTTA